MVLLVGGLASTAPSPSASDLKYYATGTISLDKEVYSPEDGAILTVTVVDADRNLDSGAVDGFTGTEAPGVIIQVTRDDVPLAAYDPPVAITMAETGKNTNTFQGRHTLSSEVEDGDVIVVMYLDSEDVSGDPRTITAYASVRAHTGELVLDKAEYRMGESVKVTVTDIDLDLDPQVKDTIAAGTVGAEGVVDVRTSTDRTGMTISLTETAVDSGVFEGSFTLGTFTAGSTIKASKHDTITVRYNDAHDASGRSVDIIVNAQVFASTGAIQLDKDRYSVNAQVTVTITDPDENENVDAVDWIPNTALNIRTTSISWPLNPTNDIDETGVDTGVFEYVFTLNQPVGGAILTARDGDSLVVTYIDPVDAEGRQDVAVTAVAEIGHTTGTVTFDKSSYEFTDVAKITVEDPDMNTNAGLRESFEIAVFSDTDLAGIALTVTETGVNTGVFEGAFTFTTRASESGRLSVTEGDIITAKYVDETPKPEDVAGYQPETYPIPPIVIKATASLGEPRPALPILTSSPELQDAQGNPLVKGAVGVQVLLVTEISNLASTTQSMLYIVQIKDSVGAVVYLSFISGNVPGKGSLTLGIAWTPEEAGSYTVEVFAWKSWSDPTPLAETKSVEITVE
ncbi:hypothetical protein [Candidatus Hecatella orcuttiae]|uniref:hypothetical protein n=1 Tax=Candidatus Hecatella orcuttiae TaxID=1935119 RepID=UPI002867B7D1|nr:hypothetical protein [Candidatus Hecatella orcuttiae]